MTARILCLTFASLWLAHAQAQSQTVQFDNHDGSHDFDFLIGN